METKVKNELLIIIVLTVLLIIIITFLPRGILHAIFGLLVALFFPGYALMAALFPRKGDLGGIERVALSFGLSLPVAAFIGLIFNYTLWGIRPEPVLYSVACFIFIVSGIAWVRRRNLTAEERFSIKFHLAIPGWGEAIGNRVLSIILAIAILGAIVTLGYVMATPETGERFTQFYILGLEGKAEGYPEKLVVGEEARVILGIVNEEQEEMRYRVEVTVDGVINEEIGPVVLAHQERWERKTSFTLDKAGGNQKVEFRLYRCEEGEPYRRLYLWVDATE